MSVKNFFKLKKTHPKIKDNILKLDKKLVFGIHKKYIPKKRQIKYAKLFLSAKEKIIVFCGITAIFFGIVVALYNFAQNHIIPMPAYGGTYREGVVGEPKYFNPLYSSLSSVDQTVSKLVFSGLMKYDLNGNLIYDIADSISSNDDKDEYTIKLKKDVKFHDNELLTANDVAFTIAKIKDEKIKSPLRKQFFNVEVEVIDELTVKIKLKESFDNFISTLTFGILPKHKWIDVDSEKFTLSELNKNPIGSGPYVFSASVEDTILGIITIRLEQNKNFYAKKPFIKTVEIKSVLNADHALDLFLRQEIDGLGALTGNEIERLDSKRALQHVFYMPEYTGIFFNQIREPTLKRQSLRDALSLAIDKEKIVKDVLPGRALVANTTFTDGMLGFIKGEHEFNVEKANKILDDDHFEQITQEKYLEEKTNELIDEWKKTYKEEKKENPSDEQIIEQKKAIHELVNSAIDPLQPFFRKRNNAFLEINISYAENKDAILIAEIIQSEWRTIGVHTTLTPVASQLLERETFTARNYDAILISVILGSNPDPFLLWYDAGNENRITLARFVDRNLDDLLESARNTKDEIKKEEFYKKFQQFILEKKPVIVLFNPTYHYALHPRVKGVVDGRITTPIDRFADIENWYIKTDKQWVFNK